MSQACFFLVILSRKQQQRIKKREKQKEKKKREVRECVSERERDSRYNEQFFLRKDTETLTKRRVHKLSLPGGIPNWHLEHNVGVSYSNSQLSF